MELNRGEHEDSIYKMEILCTEYVKQTIDHFRKRVMRTKFLRFLANRIWKVPLYYSGSRAEGISSETSDTDFMYEARGVFTLSNERQTGVTDGNRMVSVVMDTRKVHPGYTKVKILHGEMNDLSEFALNADGIQSLCKGNSQYLSNILVKRYWDTHMESVMPIHGRKNEISPHGPCIVTKYAADKHVAEIDTMLCLRVEWPEVAKEWLERDRNFNWPTKELIEEIREAGCNLVPIGHHLSPENELELEWRISFSKAECLLIWSLNGTQIACIESMKLFFQKLISPKFRDLFPSYFIKTAMFWLIEDTESTFWQPQNLLVCLERLLSKLITCVEKKCIHNFFIPDNNMMDAKAVEAADALEMLHKELKMYKGKGGEKWLLLIKEKLSQIDKNDIYHYHVMINSLSVARHFIYNSIHDSNMKDCKDKLIQGINELKCCDDKDMLPDVRKLLIQELEAMLSIATFCESRPDPEKDGMLSPNDTKRMEETLEQCAELTPSIGKLLLCTLYFYSKRYHEALAITEDIQNGYTSQVVHYTFWNRSKTPKDQHYLHITPRPTLKETLNNYIALDAVFLPCLSRLYAPAIQEKLCSGDTLFIHPLFYATFIQFHCFYSLRHFDNCKDALNKMKTFVMENMDVFKTTRDFNILDLGDSCHQYLGRHTGSGNYFKETLKSLSQKDNC